MRIAWGPSSPPSRHPVGPLSTRSLARLFLPCPKLLADHGFAHYSPLFARCHTTTPHKKTEQPKISSTTAQHVQRSRSWSFPDSWENVLIAPFAISPHSCQRMQISGYFLNWGFAVPFKRMLVIVRMWECPRRGNASWFLRRFSRHFHRRRQCLHCEEMVFISHSDHVQPRESLQSREHIGELVGCWVLVSTGCYYQPQTLVINQLSTRLVTRPVYLPAIMWWFMMMRLIPIPSNPSDMYIGIQIQKQLSPSTSTTLLLDARRAYTLMTS